MNENSSLTYTVLQYPLQNGYMGTVPQTYLINIIPLNVRDFFPIKITK